MRVDLHYGPHSIPENDRTTTQSSAAGSSSRVELGQDQALLSGAHIQVQALAAQASQLPEIREEKVQALRQAVQSGQYQADPQKVAQAVAAHMALGTVA